MPLWIRTFIDVFLITTGATAAVGAFMGLIALLVGVEPAWLSATLLIVLSLLMVSALVTFGVHAQ